MTNSAFKTYANEHGGRVMVLFLLFLLAIYMFVNAGFSAFAIVCIIPLMLIMTITSFRHRMLVFWALIIINYIIGWKHFPSTGIPTSLYNEALEIVLLTIVIIDVKGSRFERLGNIMLLTLLLWCSFCTLEVLNDTCGIGIDVARWYPTARQMAYQMMYCFAVFTLYITNPKILNKYLFVWGALALFSVFWIWKQSKLGLTGTETTWLHSSAGRQHLIQAGTLIRYWSIFNDAATYGIGIAATAVAFTIFGITSKIKSHKLFFLITGAACAWAVFPTGTRTAMAALMAGFLAYVFLSKSIRIAIPVSIAFGIFVFILAFTNIGNGNQQIRRMRSTFDRKDASANVRTANQAAMKKYLDEAPWGIGMAVGYRNVPANNKYTFMATVPPDSEYVFIWIHTGIIGITTFLILTAIMLLGACWIVLFTLKSPSLRGIGAGMCSAFVAMQLGAYGNQVLTQFPNCLITYGGLTIVYILPHIEQEWIEYENKLLAKQEEKKRLKLEKKKTVTH